MCQACRDWLPDRVNEIIDGRLRECPQAEWARGHIVFSDYNLEDEHIDWCIQEIDQWLKMGQPLYDGKYPRKEMERDRAALVELRSIPQSERDPRIGQTWYEDM